MKYSIQSKKQLRRSIGRQTWNLLSKLPLQARAFVLRRMLNCETHHLPPNLIFKRAETVQEMEQAFRVAYESFHERGLVKNERHRLRITKFHALPTTSVLIAKMDDQVVATTSVIIDSGLGLPMEKLWNLGALREKSSRIAEISTLAIDPKHRGQRGQLLLPFLDYARRLSVDELGIDTFVATYHPEVSDFYRCILLFDDLDNGQVKEYEFVRGAAAVGGWLPLKDMPLRYKKAYGTRPSKCNMYHLISNPAPPNYQLKDQKEGLCSGFHFAPSHLQYFFQRKSNILSTLTPQERRLMASTYFHPEYEEILAVDAKSTSSRTAPRFHVALEAELSLPFCGDGQGRILDISRKGLRVHAPHLSGTRPHETIFLRIHLPGKGKVPLRARVCWSQPGGHLGLRLHGFLPRHWNEMILQFEERLLERTRLCEV